jgi:hypothetical protein
MPVFAGTQGSQGIVVTLGTSGVTIYANPGQTPYIDYANRAAGSTTLSIKALTSGVNIGNLSAAKY